MVERTKDGYLVFTKKVYSRVSPEEPWEQKEKNLGPSPRKASCVPAALRAPGLRSGGCGTEGPLTAGLTTRAVAAMQFWRLKSQITVSPRRRFLHRGRSVSSCPSDLLLVLLAVPNPAVLITWLVPLRLHIPSPLRSSVSVSQSPLPTGTPGLLCDRISAAHPDDFIATPLHMIKSAKTQLPHRVTSTGVRRSRWVSDISHWWVMNPLCLILLYVDRILNRG